MQPQQVLRQQSNATKLQFQSISPNLTNLLEYFPLQLQEKIKLWRTYCVVPPATEVMVVICLVLHIGQSTGAGLLCKETSGTALAKLFCGMAITGCCCG